MTRLTNDRIQSLAAVRADEPTVVSCYLDIDGARFLAPHDYQRNYERLAKRALANGHPASVAADIDRIRSTIAAGFDRSVVRGVAVFAGPDCFEVVESPVPVRNELVVNLTPSLGQLESLLQHSDRVGVLLVDKQTARCLVYRLGELEDERITHDELPRDYDSVGEADRGGTDHHAEDLAHQHLRHAAALAWEVHQDEPLDRLLVGASETIAGEVLGDLHPYLRERCLGRVDLGVDASGAEVRTATLAAEAEAEASREAGLVDDLRAAVASGGRGVVGLDATFVALFDHRVDRLLVSDGFALEGWRCGSCDRLAALGPGCPSCGDRMHHVDDVVAEAVEEAIALSCRVEMCTGNADLDVLGRIGALLRY